MKNILFVSSECVPFIKTGGLADVAGELPKYIDKENKKQQLIDILKENYITPTLDVNNYFNNSNKEHLDIQKDKEGWQIINLEKNYRYAGSQWWSLTNDCVLWILDKLNTTNYYNDFKCRFRL